MFFCFVWVKWSALHFFLYVTVYFVWQIFRARWCFCKHLHFVNRTYCTLFHWKARNTYRYILIQSVMPSFEIEIILTKYIHIHTLIRSCASIYNLLILCCLMYCWIFLCCLNSKHIIKEFKTNRHTQNTHIHTHTFQAIAPHFSNKNQPNTVPFFCRFIIINVVILISDFAFSFFGCINLVFDICFHSFLLWYWLLINIVSCLCASMQKCIPAAKHIALIVSDATVICVPYVLYYFLELFVIDKYKCGGTNRVCIGLVCIFTSIHFRRIT